MKTKKVKIKNRKGQTIVVLIEKNKEDRGLVFITHGLTGLKEQKHIRIFAEAFLESGYSVITYDLTCSIGESGGKVEDVTLTEYLHDLEDIIYWSESLEWFKEPFVLSGHSLGSMAAIIYAQNNPDSVKALAPISTVFSGKLFLKSRSGEFFNEWKEKGYWLKESASEPDVISKINWNFVEDLLKYDIFNKINKLIMPILLIVGENDGYKVEYHKKFFQLLPGQKELYVIKGAPHTFKEKKHLQEIKKIFLKWINIL